MSVPPSSELACQEPEWPIRCSLEDLVHVGIVAEQGNVCRPGQHGDASVRIPAANGAKQGSREENVADGAEPDSEHIRGDGRVLHGVKN
jgi:hypothetical protein